MPKSENEMWLEEYAHALENFKNALTRVRVAVDSVRVENNKLRSELIIYQQLWKSAEAVIKKHGLEEEKEYTGKEAKEKYFPIKIDTDTVSSNSECEHPNWDVFYSKDQIVCNKCGKVKWISKEKNDPN